MDERKIRVLYNVLIKNGFISPATAYSVFHFRFSGKDKPVETLPICWEKNKNDLAYLIYRLTRKDIRDTNCKASLTSNDIFSKTKKFFIVKGNSWRSSDNLSDMASKLNFADKETVDGLLDELFECS